MDTYSNAHGIKYALCSLHISVTRLFVEISVCTGSWLIPPAEESLAQSADQLFLLQALPSAAFIQTRYQQPIPHLFLSSATVAQGATFPRPLQRSRSGTLACIAVRQATGPPCHLFHCHPSRLPYSAFLCVPRCCWGRFCRLWTCRNELFRKRPIRMPPKLYPGSAH